MGESSKNGGFSIAMFDYQRVIPGTVIQRPRIGAYKCQFRKPLLNCVPEMWY